MIKYAGIEFANSSSQWEVRACFPDQKEEGAFFDQTHADNPFKRNGIHIYREKNMKQNFVKKEHLINKKPADTLFEA